MGAGALMLMLTTPLHNDVSSTSPRLHFTVLITVVKFFGDKLDMLM